MAALPPGNNAPQTSMPIDAKPNEADDGSDIENVDAAALVRAAERIELSNLPEAQTSKRSVFGGAPAALLVDEDAATAPVNLVERVQAENGVDVASPKPKSAEAVGADQQPVVGVIIVDDGTSTSVAAAIDSIGDDRPVVFLTRDNQTPIAREALDAGANVVKLPAQTVNPGRIRNTGYRRLKALDPNIGFVQFMSPDFVLDENWIPEALAFMERRPEVAILDGIARDQFREQSVLNKLSEIARPAGEGELQACGNTIFVRAEAFESAGGFRGDIETNDTEDLCLRMRRRGQHGWRIEKEMGVTHSRKLKLPDWWRNAKRNGFEYAHGVFLHGAPPERFRVLEQTRAVVWGGAFPMLIILSAIISAIGVKFLSPMSNPAIIALMILSFGVMVYFAKVLLIAMRFGIGNWSSWVYGFVTTTGHFPEFLGVAKFYLSPRSGNTKQSRKS